MARRALLSPGRVNRTEVLHARSRRPDLEVGVAYDTDLTRGRHLPFEAAQSVDGVFEEPPPQAYIDEFADSAVTLVVQFWHDDGARVEVRDRVAAAVKTAFDEAGIDMPFPQREVRLDQPDG